MPNGHPDNFFALVEGEQGVDVRRLSLNRDAQESVTGIFREAREEFVRRDDFQEVPYDGLYKPDRGELLVIDPFELPEVIPQALEEPTLFPRLDLRADEAPVVKAIFTGRVTDGEPQVLFQAFHRDQYFHNRRFSLLFERGMFRRLDHPGFTVRGDLHAVYQEGKLLFKQEWWVKQILDISAHYREATDRELEEFVDLPSVAVHDRETFYDHSDTWVRKRIAQINDRQILQNHSASQIRDRGRELDIVINVRQEDDQEQIVLPESKSELKQTLRFLNEDVYAGPITEDRFVSNSKRPLETD